MLSSDNNFPRLPPITDFSPFHFQESNSEIIYDDNGDPSEVIVYVDGDGDLGPDTTAMTTSESRGGPPRFRQRHRQQQGRYRQQQQGTPGRRRAGGVRWRGQQQQQRNFGQRRQGQQHPMRSAESSYFHLPDADGYYDGEAEYDDEVGTEVREIDRGDRGGGGGAGSTYSMYWGGGSGGGSISRGDHFSGNLEYVGGDVDVYSPLRRSSYGHDHHDDHHGGYDDHHDHHGGGYHDDHDHGYSPVKKPGPFGYGKPNYKCEYAKETLYVSKTTYKFKKKCYKILKVKCKTKYGKGKKIGYKKICNEFSITKCRTIFATKFKTKCWLVYKKKCEDFYKTKVDWVYKEKCSQIYEKECHGYGYHKQCHEVPKEICKQIPVKKEKQIKSIKCKKVPDKKCKVRWQRSGISKEKKSQFEISIKICLKIFIAFGVEKRKGKEKRNFQIKGS